MSRIAFYTFGVLRETPGHQQVRPFWNRAPKVLEVAENTDGFIYRSLEGGQNPHFYDEQKYPVSPPDDPGARAPATLSLWTDLESVYVFAYQGPHAEALRKRKEWFVKPEWPTYVAWWVHDDHVPTHEEVIARQRHIYEDGSTPYAFDFKTPFDETGNPTRMNRSVIEERRPAV